MRALVVEDDQNFAEIISLVLRQDLEGMNVAVHQASSLAEAKSCIADSRYDFYIVDYMLGDGTGLELLSKLRAEGSTGPVIFLSALADTRIAVAAMKAGSTDYLPKDESLLDQLPPTIRQALERHHREEQRRRAEEVLRHDVERLFDIVATHFDVVTTDMTHEAILSLIVQRAEKLTGASGCSVEMVEGDELVCAAATGMEAPRLGTHLKISYSLSGEAVLSGDIARCDDTHADSRGYPDTCGDNGVRSLVAVPLNCKKTTLGVLKVISPRPHTFGDRDVYTLLLMGGFIAADTNRALDLEAKQALVKKLQESEERLERIIETSPQGIVVMDTHGRITFANKIVEEVMGLDRQDLIGLTFETSAWRMKTLGGEPVPEQERPSVRVMRTGEPVYGVEYIYESADGKELVASVNSAPMRNGSGDLVGVVTSITDITESKQAEEQLNRANETLASRVEELEQRARELILVGEMGEMLQACRTTSEAYRVISRSVQQLFPDLAGSLSIIGEQNLVETIASWGIRPESIPVFPPDDCWALRRGRMHVVIDPVVDPVCQHVTAPMSFGCLCVPLIAQRETLGILHFCEVEGNARLTGSRQQLARTVAEQISLALANLKLQETLRSQSIRDPLTGLYNRRYMEEALRREVKRVERNHLPLGILMIDIDHFKKFNDTYGHEAGDAMLREFGCLLQMHFRVEDIACRYGGEEFILILPEASPEDTLRRAQQLCEAARSLHVHHQQKLLGPVTLSIGLAMFPQQGPTGEAVVQAADIALYKAKRGGRDQVVVAVR